MKADGTCALCVLQKDLRVTLWRLVAVSVVCGAIGMLIATVWR